MLGRKRRQVVCSEGIDRLGHWLRLAFGSRHLRRRKSWQRRREGAVGVHDHGRLGRRASQRETIFCLLLDCVGAFVFRRFVVGSQQRPNAFLPRSVVAESKVGDCESEYGETLSWAGPHHTHHDSRSPVPSPPSAPAARLLPALCIPESGPTRSVDLAEHDSPTHVHAAPATRRLLNTTS